MDIVDRIQHLADDNGISIAALERATGLSNGIIKKWKRQSPSCDKIIAIANYLNVSIEYILLGKYQPSKVSDDVKQLLEYYNELDDLDKGIVLGKAETLVELAAERKAEKEKAKAIKFKTAFEEPKAINIELFELPASAGTGVYLSSGYSEPINVLCTPESEQANYAIRISGDSMMPDYNNGDIVLVESCDNVELGEIGIFVLDGESYIKENGGYRLISHNPKYKDILLKEYESISCRGRVLGKAKVM